MTKSNCEKGMYNQLMEVMARLDSVEKDLHIEKIEHKDDVVRLNAKIDNLVFFMRGNISTAVFLFYPFSETSRNYFASCGQRPPSCKSQFLTTTLVTCPQPSC